MDKDGLKLLTSYLKMDPYHQYFPQFMLSVNTHPRVSENCCPIASEAKIIHTVVHGSAN